MSRLKTLLIPLFFPLLLFSQQQEREVLLYNIGFGGLSAGIGAAINHKENNWKKSFLKGFWQGSIGGVINYSSKKTLYLVGQNNNYGYALPARFLNCAGNSIVLNAAYAQPFLKNWFFEYGPLRLEYYGNSTNKWHARLLPEGILASAISLRRGYFDLETTLLTGVMAFKTKEYISPERKNVDGVNYGRAFVYYDYDSSSIKYPVVAHEIIHEFQYREHLVLNSYFQAGEMKKGFMKNLFTKYLYSDVPYFALFYMIQGVSPSPRFYDNFYEFEAERFATNKMIKRF
jgi:hypothetical protein